MLQNRTTPATPTRQRAIDRQLAQLPAMDRRALEKLWRELFDRVPSPALRRETLIPILAYRIQEKAFGGLRESTASKLRKLAEEPAGGSRPVQDAVRPKTGTRYVREYDGKLHEVTVLDFGYEYQGNAYRSLTEIAKVITGTKWSGTGFLWPQARAKKGNRMKPPMRCAIYTRKSSEEGLEQSFNSLDAQREACEAYIKSQHHEGWRLIASRYDDGGYSGGNVERPALKQLMADIQTGKVSVVVVYKVDRLTRSLSDFAKIVEQFDKSHVSFVSVTQQFNTTSSMGRLTLNVLLSFAQFEREVTGERIRDKIAASKKKGMWMGGTVPLGYTARDRKLVVNELEAATVCTIFDEFLRLGSVHRLQQWLRENNIKSRSGNHFFRGALYIILRNPHCIGLIKHKKDSYPGEHQAIIQRETWDKVQALLDDNIQGQRRELRATKASLFTGILFDDAGTRYTPTHANKNGRRYRYYTSQAVIKKAEKGSTPARIPAHDLETPVVGRILDWLQTPTELLAALRDETIQTAPEGFLVRILEQAAKTAQSWHERVAADRTQFLKTVIERVVIHPSHLEICLRLPAVVNEILGSDPSAVGLPPIASLDCAFRHVQQGRALRLIIGDTDITTDASRQAILRAIARARGWYEQITTGQARTIAQLAGLHGVSPRFIRMHMKLVQLGPQAIETMIRRPHSLPLSLTDLLVAIPMNWNEQISGAPAGA